MKKIFTVLLILFLPLYIFLFSVEVNTFNKDFYLESYKDHGVPAKSAKTMEELELVTEDLIAYIEEPSSGEELLEPHFNEREIRHMEDVQFLFKYGFILKRLALILSLLSIVYFLFFEGPKLLSRTIFYGNFIWLGMILLLFLLSTIDFTKYFTYFHLIFFDNDLWILDPSKDLLIQMLPEQFFISIFLRIVVGFIFVLGILQVISFLSIRNKKDEGVR